MGSAGSQSSLSESKASAFESVVGLILLKPGDAAGCRGIGLALRSGAAQSLGPCCSWLPRGSSPHLLHPRD